MEKRIVISQWSEFSNWTSWQDLLDANGLWWSMDWMDHPPIPVTKKIWSLSLWYSDMGQKQKNVQCTYRYHYINVMRMAPKQDETNPGAHLNWQMTDTEIVQQHPEATCLVSPIQQTIWTNMRSARWPGIPKANLSNLHYRLTCTTCPVLVSSVIIIILQHIKQQV